MAVAQEAVNKNKEVSEMAVIEAGLHDFTDFSPFKPDVYEFIIKDPMQVEPVVDQKTDIGGKCFNFILYPEVVGGEYAGRKVRRQFGNGSKGSRYFMKSFFEKIGVPMTKEGAFNSEDLLGKKFKAGVAQRGYNDQQGNPKVANDLDTESAVAA